MDPRHSNFEDVETLLAVLQGGATAAATFVQGSNQEQQKEDHRKLPRSRRRSFDHAGALAAIRRDYLPRLGDTALHGADFHMMFRLSRSRFQVLMEDVMNSDGLQFFKQSPLDGTSRASLEAKLLLPLKTMAYGVPPHTFTDYFSMSMQHSRECCKQFHKAIIHLYMDDFLRLPTALDLKRIVELHKTVHSVHGMMGSLDCTHVFWKNCPKAWQGSYQGKEAKPSLVLEGICDYHLFFWHASFGYCGNMNDLTILSLSPFLERLLDGSLESVEAEAGIVPFLIMGEEFHKCFVLVDGIYPHWSRFVRGIKEPILDEEKLFTEWQEGARKDIERAFGVLKIVWQCVDRPVLLHNLVEIKNLVLCSLLLHNILVTDRVMAGPQYDYRQTYDPSFDLGADTVADIHQPQDLGSVQARQPGENAAIVGVANAPPSIQNAVIAEIERRMTRMQATNDLHDEEENRRLHLAIKNMLTKQQKL